MNKKILIMIMIIGVGIISIYPNQYQKVNSNGLDIYYRTFGEGKPILIIGGGPGDVSDRYLSLCEVLSKTAQCILVDQRGTGKSSPKIYNETSISISLTLKDFEQIRKKIGVDKWDVLGFSYGGFVASLYAHYYPQSTSSLILLGSMGLNTSGFGHFLDNITSRMQAVDHKKFDFWNDPKRKKKYPKHSLVERIKARMPGYFYDREKSLFVTETMKDSDFNFEMGQWIWSDIKKRGLDLSQKDPKFKGSVLILHGRQDPLGESKAQTLSRYYKDSKLVFVEKAGHYSWIEQPEEIKKNIKTFLKNNNEKK